MKELLEKVSGNPPIARAALDQFEQRSDLALPDDYKQFLMLMNGGQGWVGKLYVIFYPLEMLLENNKAYHFPGFFPGLFLFADDGGGEAFAFDYRKTGPPVVRIPFVGELADSIEVGSSFREFIANFHSGGFQ